MKANIFSAIFILLFGAAVFFTDGFFYTRGAKIYPFVGLLLMIWGVIYIVLTVYYNKRPSKGKRSDNIQNNANRTKTKS